jgi:hypothetical protein
MRRLTDDEKKAVSILNNRTIETKDNIDFINLIDAKDSHTTNSSYIILQDKSGLLYQLALSDHSSRVHDYEFDELDEDEIGMDIEDIKQILYDGFELGILHSYDLYNFGIQKAEKYSLNPKDLIGRLVQDRAWVSDQYKINEAKLSYNNQLLSVDYGWGHIENYINYEPDDSTKEDCILARWLNEQGANKKDYNHYSIMTVEEYAYDLDYTVEEVLENELTDDPSIEAVVDDKYIIFYR